MLILNAAGLGLLVAISRKAKGGRLSMTPSPWMIAGFYMAVLSLAILSVLFFNSRPF